MTTKLTREQAEAALEQITLQFKPYLEPGYGPKLMEDWTDPDADGDQHWAICWEEGAPYEWTYRAQQGGRDVELTSLARDVDPSAVMDTPPAPNWPVGVFGEPVNHCVLALYPA